MENYNLVGDTQLLSEIVSGDKGRRQELQQPIATFPDSLHQLLEIPLHTPNDNSLMMAAAAAARILPPNEQNLLEAAMKDLENYI